MSPLVFRIAVLACVCTCVGRAQSQAWSLRDDAPPVTGLHRAYFDSVRGMGVVHTLFPPAVWALRNGRWSRWAGAELPSLPNGQSTFLLLLGYDEQRGEAVAVASPFSHLPPRTYVSSGATWQHRPTVAGPTAQQAGVAFDRARGNLVVFGGQAQAYQLVDTTHVWNGTAWQLVPTANAPSPRANPAMAYDAARNKIVLYGGGDYPQVFGDTWEFDGTNWQLVAATGPAPRNGALHFDPALQRVVLLGGSTQTGTLLDCWSWDGTQWQPYPAMPANATGHGWNDGSRIVLLGRNDEVWQSTAAGWTQLQVATDTLRRSGAAIAYDPQQGELLLAGGWPTGDTWRWRDRWQLVAGAAAGPGTRHGTAMASYGPGMVLFGGAIPIYGYVADTWLWNGAAWQSVLLPQWPQPRVGHRMTGTGTSALLFGGMGSMGPLDDLWEFDGAQWTQRLAATAPPARADHGFAYDPVRQRAVLHGGWDHQNVLGDLWEWDGAQWHQKVPATALPQAYAFELAYDAARGGVVTLAQEELWSWDGTDWTSVGPAPSGDPSATSLVYDVVGQRLLTYTNSQSLWTLGPTPSGAALLGAGCGLPSDLSMLGRAVPGETPELHLSSAPASVAALALGLAGASVVWTPQCVQVARVDASVFGVTAANGVWDQSLMLPNVPALRGVQVFAQAVVLDGGTALGVSFTNGLLVAIGD